jgi:hypothetical protein
MDPPQKRNNPFKKLMDPPQKRNDPFRPSAKTYYNPPQKINDPSENLWTISNIKIPPYET